MQLCEIKFFEIFICKNFSTRYIILLSMYSRNAYSVAGDVFYTDWSQLAVVVIVYKSSRVVVLTGNEVVTR